MEDRGLPSSIEAERSILGSILLDGDSMYTEAAESLSADDFYLDSHRCVYRCMSELARANTSIDLITIQKELPKRKQLETIGGAGYLASLTDGVPRRASIA